MGFIRYAVDTLTSLVSGLGTERDKAASVYYAAPQWSDQDLLNAFRGSWLARKIVTIPASDATREWRNWQAENEQITKIEAEEKRLGLPLKVLEAKTKARLYGGAALYFVVKGQENQAGEPLDVESVGLQGISYVTVLPKRDLSPGEIERDIASEWYGRPAWYEIAGTASPGVIRVHPSRLAIFKGTDVPDAELIGGVGVGWGDSVLVSTMRTIQQTDSVAANIASLVFEAKVDVVRVPDLMASLADEEYKNRLLDRFRLAATAKGNNGMLLLDKEEEYEQKSASFATLPDILDRFLQMVSGAADIPMTRFIGRSPGGLNSTGEGDIVNYYDHIRTIQTTEIQPALARLDECLIRSALGDRPDDIHYRWAPLKQMTPKEIAEIGVQQATIIEKLNNASLFPPEGLANASMNMLTESGVMPGLDQEVADAGGLPDYEAEMAAENQRQVETAAAIAAAKGGGTTGAE